MRRKIEDLNQEDWDDAQDLISKQNKQIETLQRENEQNECQLETMNQVIRDLKRENEELRHLRAKVWEAFDIVDNERDQLQAKCERMEAVVEAAKKFKRDVFDFGSTDKKELFDTLKALEETGGDGDVWIYS